MKSMNLIHLYVDDTIRLRGRQSYFLYGFSWIPKGMWPHTIVKTNGNIQGNISDMIH